MPSASSPFLWLVLNHFDEHAEDYPLVRLKYALLPLVTYLVGLDCFYQLSYFLGLHPQVITSCCGALFTVGGAGLAGDLAGLPVVPTMVAFYAGAGLLALLLGACLTWKSGWLRLLLALVAAAFLPLALAAIISFISLYVYQLPTHHCPFDLFQGHYHYLGYPLYLSLFAAVLYGVLPGLFRPLARQPFPRAAAARCRPALAAAGPAGPAALPAPGDRARGPGAAGFGRLWVWVRGESGCSWKGSPNLPLRRDPSTASGVGGRFRWCAGQLWAPARAPVLAGEPRLPVGLPAADRILADGHPTFTAAEAGKPAIVEQSFEELGFDHVVAAIGVANLDQHGEFSLDRDHSGASARPLRCQRTPCLATLKGEVEGRRRSGDNGHVRRLAVLSET